MKIALLGYGRMGQAIEKIAVERGHDIVLKIDKNSKEYDLTKADIAIDFSVPSAAFKNITSCFEIGLPVISGTTGWLEQYQKALEICNINNGSFIYASNFSLGVNVFFELNTYLAKMMSSLKDYKVSMEEIHHIKKLDAPSGTAITLAKGIIENTEYESWALDAANSPDEIPIVAKRIPDVPGTHKIKYTSKIDTLEIKHTAHSREGFALGAIVAAEWLLGKKGVYSMKDVLGL